MKVFQEALQLYHPLRFGGKKKKQHAFQNKRLFNPFSTFFASKSKKLKMLADIECINSGFYSTNEQNLSF